jgi:hypothetical protein
MRRSARKFWHANFIRIKANKTNYPKGGNRS